MLRRKLGRASVLGFGLALVLSACGGGGGGGGGGTGGNAGSPTKGGTLRIVNNADVDYYDPANAYYTVSWTQMRLLTRQLYSYDITKTGTPEASDPVPDLADGPAKVGGNNTTFTFTAPVTGTYRIVLDPWDAYTGSTTLVLT